MLKSGLKLKELRIKKGWTQSTLAEQLGVTQHTISQWETGTRLVDMETFQQALSLLEAKLVVERDLSQSDSTCYRLEDCTFDSDIPRISCHFRHHRGNNPNDYRIYQIEIERNHQRLILPEFLSDGRIEFDTFERYATVLESLGLDYALWEDCPTYTDYLVKRSIETPTQCHFQEFQRLQSDMDLAMQCFSREELAEFSGQVEAYATEWIIDKTS